MYCTYDLLTVHAEISYVVNLFISSNISIVASKPAVQMFIHVACVYQLAAVCFDHVYNTVNAHKHPKKEWHEK